MFQVNKRVFVSIFVENKAFFCGDLEVFLILSTTGLQACYRNEAGRLSTQLTGVSLSLSFSPYLWRLLLWSSIFKDHPFCTLMTGTPQPPDRWSTHPSDRTPPGASTARSFRVAPPLRWDHGDPIRSRFPMESTARLSDPSHYGCETDST